MRASESKRQRITEEIKSDRAITNWKELVKKTLACICAFPAFLGRTARRMAHETGLQETQENQVDEFRKYKIARPRKPVGGRSGAKGKGSPGTGSNGFPPDWSEVPEDKDQDPDGIVDWATANHLTEAIPQKIPITFKSSEPPTMNKDEELQKELRKNCSHSKTTKHGSNQFVNIVTCKFCGMTLSKTRTQLGLEVDEKKAKERDKKRANCHRRKEVGHWRTQPEHQCPYCRQKFKTDEALQLHLKGGLTAWALAEQLNLQNRDRAQPQCGTAPSDSD